MVFDDGGRLGRDENVIILEDDDGSDVMPAGEGGVEATLFEASSPAPVRQVKKKAAIGKKVGAGKKKVKKKTKKRARKSS